MTIHMQIIALFTRFCTETVYADARNKWVTADLIIEILNRMQQDEHDRILIQARAFNQTMSGDRIGYNPDDFSTSNSSGVFRKKCGHETVYFITEKNNRPQQPKKVDKVWIGEVKATSLSWLSATH